MDKDIDIEIEIMKNNMFKNQRKAIDITLFPHDKLQGKSVEQIVEDLMKLMED